MQINNNSLSLSAAIGQTPAIDQNQAAGVRDGGSSIGGDSVQLSSLASQLAADPSHLEQLQAAYQSGTYSIFPSQIANSLINETLLQ
jgi:anti-sigma28 factor (negative regulator of flagellin synthesis)